MVVFSWGWTGFGQSGTGLEGGGVDQAIISPTICKLPPHTKLTSLSGGNFHSACVDTKGNIYTWGNARHGECGHVSKEERNGDNGSNSGPDKEEELIPRRIRIKGVRFKLVACGMYHTIALTNDNRVFGWGSNELGQLGLGKYAPLSTTKPLHLDALDKASIFTISCGDSFSVAIGLRLIKKRENSESCNETKEMDILKDSTTQHQDGCMIFTWGENNKGQLGRDSNGQLYDKFVGHVKLENETENDASSLESKVGLSPSKSLQSEAMVNVAACGAEHMLLLTTKGIVYSCGSGCDGQLGLGDYKDTPTPKPIQNFLSRGLVVSKISANGNVSGALAFGFNKFALKASSMSSSISNTSVYMWGSNAEGQLGDGGCGITRRNLPGPCYVGGQYEVMDITLGEDHAIALCKEREVSKHNLLHLRRKENDGLLKTDTLINLPKNRYKQKMHHVENNGSKHSMKNKNRADKKVTKALLSEGKVIGNLVAWGRSAAGRLGIGDVEAFQSHIVHGMATGSTTHLSEAIPSKEIKDREVDGRLLDELIESGHSSGGIVDDVAFYRSMSAVFLDDSLNFHTPVTMPFNPFLDNHKEWIYDNVLYDSDDDDSDDSDDGVGSSQTLKVNKSSDLTLKGISAGGAHTLVYATFDNSHCKKKTHDRDLKHYLDDMFEEEDEDLLEFPESSQKGSTGTGWKEWKICPRIGCNTCLPDELADWHEILCKKPYPPTEAASLEISQEESIINNTEGLPSVSSLPLVSPNAHMNSKKQHLPTLPAYRNTSNSFRTSSLQAISTPTQSNTSSLSSSLPEITSPARKENEEFRTVKKRIGGGFVYLTVPKDKQ